MYRRTLIVCALAAALSACTKPEPEQARPDPVEEQNAPEILSLATESLILYPAEYAITETVTFRVTDADVVNAQASSGISAELTGTAEGYELTILATGEFTTPANVTLIASNATKETSAVIAVAKAEMTLDYETYHAPRAGASIIVSARSNVGAALKSISGLWINVNPDGGSFAVTIDRNESFSERSAEIVITDAKGIISRTMTVIQDAAIDYASNERKALEALWKSTGGENWKDLSNTTGGQTYSTANWCTDAPVSSWYGVTVNGDGHVIYLHLSDVGLKGALPEELGDMTFLQELWLSGNELSGPIPESLGKLPALKDIDMSGMNMSGSLEESSLKDIASHLKNLSISGNLFTGGFPEWVGDMPESANFWLQGNCLSGKVPEKVKIHPRWNAVVLDGSGRTVGQVNMEQREGFVLE